MKTYFVINLYEKLNLCASTSENWRTYFIFQKKNFENFKKWRAL